MFSLSLNIPSRLSGAVRLAIGFAFGAMLVYGWDAGPKECKRDECSGGKAYSTSFPDTQPKYANSVLPSDSCPAGTEWYGSGCYKACPSGWYRTAACTCRRNNSYWWDLTALWTDCSRFGYSSYPTKTCSADREYYAGLCYSRCPSGSVRAAVSTCTHTVKWMGNTHLWILNRALDMLSASSEPKAKRAAGILNESSCKLELMDGLWDADDGDLADRPEKAAGSHFYNAAGLDATGKATNTIAYMFGIDVGLIRNARSSIKDRLSRIGDLTRPGQCRDLGIALHYLTDLTQPMHSSSFSGGQSPLMLHPVMEEYVPTIQSRFPVNAAWDGRWSAMNPENVLIQTSIKSNSLAPGLMKVLGSNSTICSMLTDVLYTGPCFVHDGAVDSKIGEILRDGYQSTASFIHSVVQGARPSPSGFEGQLVSNPANGAVSFVNAGQRKWIPDPQTFSALGFSWGDVKTDARIMELPDGGAYPSLQPGQLPRHPDTGAVYLLEKGFRRWIPDPNTFAKLGLRWENVVTLPAQSVEAIPNGAAMPTQ